ncbi:hypothetical protein TSAR_009697 [Trichomalopsis sarcophagae]|uniref:Uncharacterized protein n=1 Tax=Trichomalopsis sarcophagae TaxID=543379 RepID=A0A232EZU3_9HYME|nr:hypothetical protein TSAR_009697 [Trichomalopsis sarcophagae]
MSTASQQPPTPPVTFELIVSGVPNDINPELRKIASLFLRVLQLPHLETDVFTSEAFPRSRTLHSSTLPLNPASSSVIFSNDMHLAAQSI